MASILLVALIIVSFLIPNRINKFQNDTPHEDVLNGMDNTEARPSVQAMPIHKVAERASMNVAAIARQSARYSRRS